MSLWYSGEFIYCIMLIPYPGPVNLSDEISKTEISLREAARKHSVIKSDIIKCKCKSGCKTTLYLQEKQ